MLLKIWAFPLATMTDTAKYAICGKFVGSQRAQGANENIMKSGTISRPVILIWLFVFMIEIILMFNIWEVSRPYGELSLTLFVCHLLCCQPNRLEHTKSKCTEQHVVQGSSASSKLHIFYCNFVVVFDKSGFSSDKVIVGSTILQQ